MDRQRRTQVGRALAELGIELIPAYSPQARGRSERNFGTWQGRLPQELRVAGIRTMEEANRFLREHYLGEFNRRFAVVAQEPGTAFLRVQGRDLDRVFSIQHERVVNRDNTVQLDQQVYQIEKTRWRGTLARCRVLLCEHLDGRLTIHYGPHVVASFSPQELVGTKLPAPSKRKERAA